MNKGWSGSDLLALAYVNHTQELEERTRARAGGDQEDTECTARHWTIHGSH